MSLLTAFPSDIVSNTVQSASTYLMQTALSKPVANYQQFMDKIGAAISPTRHLGNAYARQNYLEKLSSRQDPILAIDWIAVVIDNQLLNTNYQMPWYYIDEIQIPTQALAPEKRRVNGLERNYVSYYESMTSTVKFYTDVSGKTFNYANQWMRSSFRTDNFFGLPGDYKKDIQIYILDASRQCVVDFRLKGCFPTTWNEYSLGQTGSETLVTSLSITVDEVLQNYDSDLSTAKSNINAFFQSGVSAAADTIGRAGSSLLSSLF